MMPTHPPLVHSPISFCRQQASLKSVTGDSSAYRGLPAAKHIRLVETIGYEENKRTCVPPIVKIIHRLLRLCFPFVPRIHVTQQMIPYVIADVHLLQVAVLRQSTVKVLEESVKVCLQLSFGNVLTVVCGIAVDIGKEDGL